ncbi:hypothetical protein [Mycolicibacterium sp. CBMA 361]|uniref:hypothetical protein n=1 Tax=Mycolicibacterium sp. CBMA 361 TaxID=2606610 RepID=UPI001EEF966F|nr:hypothetical protein [Mycolicibacterium sp. CBMA 361]
MPIRLIIPVSSAALIAAESRSIGLVIMGSTWGKTLSAILRTGLMAHISIVS